MNRRRFLLASSSAVISTAPLKGTLQQPALGLEFNLNQVERKQPSNTDSVLLNFNKFQITPRYINTNEDLSLTIQVTLEDADTKTINKNIKMSSGEKITKTDIQPEIPIVIDKINTTKDSLDGTIQITLDHPEIQTKTYNQSFIITLQFVPLQARGGDNTFEMVDQGNNVVTENDLGVNETLEDYEGTKYRVHEFTSTGSQKFEITNIGDSDGTIEALLVGGGGGGGFSGGEAGGGGGAGGLLYETNISVSEQSYTVTVGDGGSGLTNDDVPTAENGADSTAFGLKAIGGGGGARYNQDGANGGSGGGAADAPSVTGGSALQPSTNGGSGEPGGDSNDHAHGGAGGGGANQAGGNAYGGGTSGDGGNGKYFGDIFGENVGENGDFAGGGAGGGRANSDSPNPGVGGSGGGGDGGDPDGSSADNGQPNTGGGGGGGDSSSQSGADGGSGIVLIRYPIEQTN